VQVIVAGGGGWPVSLSGNLGSFSLDEVLSLLGHTAKTGALRVHDGASEGVLYLIDGRLCAAEVDDVSGPADGLHALELRLVDAILTLGGRIDGAFDFEAERIAPFPTTDSVGVGPILERVRVLRDRWPAIERLVPSLDAPVSLVADLRSETITLDRSTWVAVASVDGRRSVRSIAQLVGDSSFEVAAALAPLVDAGAIAINAREPEPITDGVFERGTLVAAVGIAETLEPVGAVVDTAYAESPYVVDSEAPITEGPEALARLNRAELERAALGEPPEPPESSERPESPETTEAPESPETPETAVTAVVRETAPAPFDADADPDSHPAVPRDRGSLLRMFSALRDG
jgi:hypothetical protein